MLDRIQAVDPSRAVTIRNIHDTVNASSVGLGFPQLFGDPTEVADFIQERFEERVADGFNLMPATLRDLTNFIELVIRILRQRGVHREAYRAGTFRSMLNVPRPENQFTTSWAQRSTKNHWIPEGAVFKSVNDAGTSAVERLSN